MDDSTVLKVALNAKGLAQNSVEHALANMSPLFADIFDHHPENFWITMELAKPITIKELLDYFGLRDPDELYYALIRIRKHPNNPRITEIIDLADKLNLEAVDFEEYDNWGKVMRNGNETLVIVDFGLSTDVYNQYYKL